MTKHIVKAYGQKLDEISWEVSRMGELAVHQLSESLKIVRQLDNELARQIIANDVEIDAAEKTVMGHITAVLALHQPMARDLRDIIAALQISAALERIGDLAKNIAKRISATPNHTLPEDLLTPVAAMGDVVHDQLVKVMTAYADRRADLAADVWKHDEQVDKMYNAVFAGILEAMKGGQQLEAAPWAHLLFISKNIERVGDYATNIAEIVSYMVSYEEPGDIRPKADITSFMSDG